MWFRNIRRCALGAAANARAAANLACATAAATALTITAAAALLVITAAIPTTSHADELAGKASIGVSLGAMRFTGGHDLRSGAGIRPMLRASFKYTWQNRFVTVLEAAYGWNSYGEGGDYSGSDTLGTIAVVTPVTLGMDYRLKSLDAKMTPRVGMGVGFYPIAIRAGRERISEDAATSHDRRVTAPGVYGKIGSDFILKPSVVLNTDLLWHHAFSGDATKFPSGFLNADASFAEVRVGINYYFKIGSTGPSAAPGTEGE